MVARQQRSRSTRSVRGIQGEQAEHVTCSIPALHASHWTSSALEQHDCAVASTVGDHRPVVQFDQVGHEPAPEA